jgi:hypothetical protein
MNKTERTALGGCKASKPLSVETPVLRYGTNRGVLTLHSIALKFALHERGARCNLYEARTFARSMGVRRDGLCPVLWCSDNGAVLVMRFATPLTPEQFECAYLKNDLPDWEHVPGEKGSPVESKASSYGLLDGRIVAIDYSAASELYDFPPHMLR